MDYISIFIVRVFDRGLYLFLSTIATTITTTTTTTITNIKTSAPL
jgi:hypothetical protein